MQVIFTDDLVVQGSRIGIVERALNSSDEDSGGDDEIEVIADNSAGGKLAPGSAHVRWRQHDSALDAGVRTEFTSELQLADRVFLLGGDGQIVRDRLGRRERRQRRFPATRGAEAERRSGGESPE